MYLELLEYEIRNRSSIIRYDDHFLKIDLFLFIKTTTVTIFKFITERFIVQGLNLCTTVMCTYPYRITNAMFHRYRTG